MRNLTGYLKKILCLFSPIFLLSFLLPTHANQNFSVYSTFQHSISETEVQTEVILQIRSDIPKVISYYTASIPIENIQPQCTNYKTGQVLDCTYYNRGSITDVLLDLNNSVVRQDNPLEIKLSYNLPTSENNAYTFSSKISDATTNSVLIRYPKEKGEPLWTSDPVQNIKSVGDNFEIELIKPIYSSISILFGENITYRFDISKVFANSLQNENQTFELYIPSDTSSQTIIWDEINPLPNIALKDEDGNYIFKYIVAPNETIDCKISGYIQKVKDLAEEEIKKTFFTQKTGYWSITNNTEFKRVNTYLKKKGLSIENSFEDINELDSNQKELFYKYIYQYVIERLNYDNDLILGITNEARLGANALTESSNNSTTIDYADFYIALLRNYQVPSRLIVGYVSNITGYTADGFYHHWVEYYDLNLKSWITVDPFLEEYFEKNLFGSSFHDHITILKRGKSAVAPKISFYKENDFTLKAETEVDILAEFDIKSELTFENYKITDKFLKGYIYVSNTGNIAISDYTISKSNVKNLQQYIDPVNNLHSQIILPKQNSILQLNIPNEKINSSNMFLNINFSNYSSYNLEKIVEAEIENIVPGYLIVLSKFLSIFVFSIFLFLIYFLINRINKKKYE